MRGTIPFGWMATGIAAGFALAMALAFCANTPTPPDTANSELLFPSQPILRNARVLIVSGARSVRLRAEGGFQLAEPRGQPKQVGKGAWVEVSLCKGAVCFDGKPAAPDTETLTPVFAPSFELSTETGPKDSSILTYPGTVKISARNQEQFDLINHVDVERYVASVVANEVWPTFATEALKAQAIASRTYVLYQMRQRDSAAFDVSATQGSQVYRGVREDDLGRRAAQAADATRGVVCTFDENGKPQLFCAYYSAACGGLSQPASIFGERGEVEPLKGGVRCDFCRIAPRGYYRWGPLRISREETLNRLAARYPDMAALGRIREVLSLERSRTGRAGTMRIEGETGKRFDLSAERFRLAIGGAELRSTDFTLRHEANDIVFENGRGFGHGLGLCQWGMQGQALAGKPAAQILRFYYPGSSITRAY